MPKKKTPKKQISKDGSEPQSSESLILPDGSIIQETSPFLRRMSGYSFRVPPPGTLAAARLQHAMDTDIAFQLKLRAVEKRLPYFMTTRMCGGSGLQVSNLLRWYFAEYFDRFTKHGPESLPTSFNVVESFLRFNREFMLFDLREEVEHLLSLNDYFHWYARIPIPQNPQILHDLIPEGIVYTYEFVGDSASYRVTGKSEQIFAAISFVRHEFELSCLLLAGENPPLQSDKSLRNHLKGCKPNKGRENLTASSDYSIKDRYLDGHPKFAKVIVLTRFDLRAAAHDVRYVMLDNGGSFTVLTDDASVFEGFSRNEKAKHKTRMLEDLKRYDDLFAALASMIYLPAFFAMDPAKIHEYEITTKLGATLDEAWVQATTKAMTASDCILQRRVRCMPLDFDIHAETQKTIQPPEMQFKCDGYWKPIGPLDIGEDKDGNPIFGRTWVARHEQWSARSPQSIMLERKKAIVDGPDPGAIYVQRSPAMEVDVYKIGLTRISPQVRADELSSGSGVALPFGVIANWQVPDCAAVENAIHQCLAAYRINPRREFFRAGLSLICAAIENVIKEFRFS